MEAFVQEIARQRHQDLLAAGERYRLARTVCDSKKPHRARSVADAESKPIPSAEQAAVAAGWRDGAASRSPAA